MSIYLTIMITILVIAEMVRITQNAISIHSQKVVMSAQLKGIEDITQQDLDTQREAYRLAVNYFKRNKHNKNGNEITGETSDGYHTFNELYHHRAILFSALCNSNRNLCWKSKQHHDPKDPMYDGMFIVGIETPYGQATYHYDIDPYWDMFHVAELKRAPEWDGHTPDQAIERLESFADELIGSYGDLEGEWFDRENGKNECSSCGALCHSKAKKCPECGAYMKNNETVYHNLARIPPPPQVAG